MLTRGLLGSCVLWLASALLQPAHAALPDFTGLVERAGPAVVNVSASSNGGGNRAQPGLDEQEVPEIFRRFLQPPNMPRMPRDRVSMGTGFLISGDGYVLTNHHVIDGADEVYVRLTDRRELKAKIIGSDEASDVALLKLEGSDFPHVALGQSKSLKPGQWVVAIGSPFGFDHSVTAGIVSAVGRASFDRSQQYVPFIQTDVAINRGNSGGPLLNTAGEVVGINSQIFSNTGGFMGVSFAIPIEVAMRSAEQLKSQGYVARGLLGVNIQDVNRDTARALGLNRTGGALVNGFSEDSAAKQAGIEVGDVILAFDGQEIRSSSDLPPLVGATAPGSKVRVTVNRDGKTRDFVVTVGELPRGPGAIARTSGDRTSVAPLGVMVDDLTQEQRQALGLGENEGVVVSRVVGAAAGRAGLQPGDVITMLGRTAIRSAEQFAERVAALPAGEPAMLLIRRGDSSQFVTLVPDAVEQD